MDDSKSTGDIAHASALKDGHLLFTPQSNYLYRFVSVRMSAFWTRCFFLSVVEILSRGKTSQFQHPADAEAFSGEQNKYNLPCGILALFEVC